MPRPIMICLELLAPAADEPYVRCTARPGREAGLALAEDGAILWRHPGPVACEVWVSADQKLIAYRRAGTPPVTLHRANRSLELPVEKPVVMRHHDELVVAEPGAKRTVPPGKEPMVRCAAGAQWRPTRQRTPYSSSRRSPTSEGDTPSMLKETVAVCRPASPVP